jgi:hypothetical protein
MTTLDLAGALCWGLMSLAFVTARSRVALFNVVCGALLLGVLGVVVFGPETPRSADAMAVVSGLGLYWAGLLILRAMLTRSVSLQLLIASADARQEAAFDQGIAGRLDEAVKYGLVRAETGRLALSPSGTALARALDGLYRLAGLH